MFMPKEVQEYFQNGIRTAVAVTTLKPYTLVVTFDDQTKKMVDLTNDLVGTMSSLKDYEVFSNPYIDTGDCIKWNTPQGVIDIDKDSIYIYGMDMANT